MVRRILIKDFSDYIGYGEKWDYNDIVLLMMMIHDTDNHYINFTIVIVIAVSKYT